jgi:hypothetical protein
MPEFWLFPFMTGCRLAQAPGLRWQDDILANETVCVGGKVRWDRGELGHIPGTKTNQIRDLQRAESLYGHGNAEAKSSLTTRLSNSLRQTLVINYET